MAELVVLFQIAACVGFGAATLQCFGVLATLESRERLPWSFAVGLGILGWLLFPIGISAHFTGASFVILLGIGVLLLPCIERSAIPDLSGQWRWIERVLLVVLALAIIFDFAEGLSPPADADSLAYHFALPRDFIAAGRIEFMRRAVDGAVPLLVQMTYATVLALGGERALTLWTFASGWGLGALFYAICRRHLERAWSLAATAVLMTVPAIIYGAGSGQVEVRLGLFALVAAASAARSLRQNDISHAALAGMAAGFYAGGKYLGLLFVATVGLVILLGPGWLKRGAAFGVAALIAGGQWYVWNWINSGDPVFPMLYGWLPDVRYWDAAHAEYFKEMFFAQERAVPIDLLWLILYPFWATLAPAVMFESGRTGFGPYLWIVLPFAIAGLIRYRARLRSSELLPIAAVAILFYVAWFASGSSQRVRHLVPILPLVVLLMTVAARRWANDPFRARPLAAAFAVVLGVQFAAQGLFTINFARYLISGESRDEFLERNVAIYRPVPWINAHLKPNDRLLLEERQLLYPIEKPTFLAHAVYDARVDLTPSATNLNKFFAEMKTLGITHILAQTPPADTRLDEIARRLVEAGCARAADTVASRFIASRTLPSFESVPQSMTIFALDRGASCRLDR